MQRVSQRIRIWAIFTYHFLTALRKFSAWKMSPLLLTKLYWSGFLPEKLNLYGLRDKKNWRPYLSDRQIWLTQFIDGDFGVAINNKLLSGILLRGIAQIPQTWAVIRDGKISVPDSGEGPHDLKSILREKGKVILKPTDRCGGKGVILLEHRNGVYFKNQQATDEEQLASLIPCSGDFILMEYVNQGKYASSLYADTVNTIRVITMLDPESRRPFVALASQRIGTSESFPVDNVSSGGLICVIDVQTGCLGKASRSFMAAQFDWIERHPESQVRFEGRLVPRWDEICREIVRLAGILRAIPYIAWDVALLDEGICIVETNSWSDLSTYQITRPLTRDPGIHRFFRHHGITGK